LFRPNSRDRQFGVSYYIGRGKAYLLVQNYDSAISDFTKSLDIQKAPSHADDGDDDGLSFDDSADAPTKLRAKAIGARGGRYYKNKDYARAASDYKSSIDDGLADVDRYVGWANALYYLQKYADAISAYSNAINKDVLIGQTHIT
jgi:tetratricopeptide (TPR) repeat protein